MSQAVQADLEGYRGLRRHPPVAPGFDRPGSSGVLSGCMVLGHGSGARDGGGVEQACAVTGAVSSLTEWVGIGLLVVLFGAVLAGIWLVLVHGVPFPLEAICLRG